MLYLLLRSENRLYDALKPNAGLFTSMKLEKHAMNAESPEVSSFACNIISFYMRYYVQVDYGDFGKSPEFIKLMRRFDGVKYASEMEDLTIKIAELERFIIEGRGGGG